MQILEGLQRQRQATSTIPTELEQLEQGDMSVAEYFWKFIRLFDSIDSEVTKIRCFVKGLESSVQHDVASVNPQTFNDAIRRAVWSEVENQNCAKVSKQEIIEPITSIRDDQSKKQPVKAKKSTHKKLLSCDCSGKEHRTQVCHRRKGSCFQCGSLEHFIKDCPRKKNVSSSITSSVETILTTATSLEIPSTM